MPKYRYIQDAVAVAAAARLQLFGGLTPPKFECPSLEMVRREALGYHPLSVEPDAQRPERVKISRTDGTAGSVILVLHGGVCETEVTPDGCGLRRVARTFFVAAQSGDFPEEWIEEIRGRLSGNTQTTPERSLREAPFSEQLHLSPFGLWWTKREFDALPPDGI